MSYINQLIEIRNGVHKNIVFAVVKETSEVHGDFLLELDSPVQFTTEVYRPYGNEVVTRVITGIDSEYHELQGTDQYGEQKTIQYRDVPVELLAQVLLQLDVKKYKLINSKKWKKSYQD
jgi:hypothetical protein